MSGEGHSKNRTARAKLGLVSHDNTGGYFIVECQGCGVVYPSFQCGGGDAIADTGDYNDAICPHCAQESPEECSNVGRAWNTQQLKINELQQRLTAADERIDQLTRPQDVQVACMPVERCYDVRAKMIIAFNETKKNGGDLDDALDAAYKSALRYSPNPLTAEQPAPVSVASRDESIVWLKRIDGIGQNRAELIYSMGFRRHTEVPQS